MKNISRRDWFKSTMAATAGLTLSSSLASRLMASPVSRAEREWMSKAAVGKVRLNANENPYGPSESARQAVTKILPEGNRYTFQVINDLKAILAKKEGLTPAHIHIGAGSGDLLCQAGVT